MNFGMNVMISFVVSTVQGALEMALHHPNDPIVKAYSGHKYFQHLQQQFQMKLESKVG